MLTQQDQAALAQWEELYLDPDYDTCSYWRRPHPPRCPICGSIEISSGRCTWCHTAIGEDEPNCTQSFI